MELKALLLADFLRIVCFSVNKISVAKFQLIVLHSCFSVMKYTVQIKNLQLAVHLEGVLVK